MKQAARILNALGPLLGLAFVFGFFSYYLYYHVEDATGQAGTLRFWDAYTVKTILQQTVIIAIAALGMTVIIISGGIDLSAGSLVALGTVVVAVILKEAGANPDLMADGQVVSSVVWKAAIWGVLACALCGLLSGVMIVGLRLVPFIVTLGMMQIVRGVAKAMADNTTVDTPSNWLAATMDIEPSPHWYSVAPAVWLMLFLLVVMFVVLRYTVFGRYVFAIGSNEATARLCGVAVNFQRVMIYTIGGFFAGVAGVLQYSSLTIGDPTAAVGLELDIIAAVVIGGGSLSGGAGSVTGSIIGALMMATLRNGCTLAGFPDYVRNIVVGGIIILAVAIDQMRHAKAK